MTARDVERVHERYASRLDSVGDRQYWRDNHAGQDMTTLWRYIGELEAKISRLEQEAAEHARWCYPENPEPPTSCQCATVRNPPCSWCCP